MTSSATIYLCGPIQGRTDDECVTWRKAVMLNWPGTCLDPLRRDYRGRELSNVDKLIRDDMDDIRRSDALLVYFDRPSIGTSMEIFYAHRILRIPVVVIDVSGAPRSPWLVGHTSVFVDSIEAGMQVLAQIVRAP